jgi:hypothetical protein
MKEQDRDDIEYAISLEKRKLAAKRHMEISSKQMSGDLSKHRINPDTLNAPVRAPKKE